MTGIYRTFFCWVFILLGLSTMHASNLWLNPSLVQVPTNKSLRVSLAYATTNNIAGVQIYPENFTAQLRPEVLEALLRAATDADKKGKKLVVLDAWRPSISGALLSYWADKRGHHGMVAPPEISTHSRGIAVDLTLESSTGTQISMPTKFDEMNNHETVHSLELKELMAKHGFTRHKREWWHFEFKASKSKPLLPGPTSLNGATYSNGILRIKR